MGKKMKKIALIVALVLMCGSAQAVELTKTSDHENGWDFLFSAKIKIKETHEIKNLPISIPLLNCNSAVPNQTCYENKRDATNAAWAQAKKFEKMMRESMKGTAP